jgi:hypothetical protein
MVRMASKCGWIIKDVAEHGPENVARDVADGLRGAYLGIQQGTIQVIFATGATAPKLLGTVGDAPADVMRLINALQRATTEARRLRESIHTDRLQGKELADAKSQIALCARRMSGEIDHFGLGIIGGA